MSWESGAGVYLGRVTGDSRIAHRSCSQSPCSAENGCSHAESSSRQRSGPSDGPWPGRWSAPGEQKARLGSPRAVVPRVPTRGRGPWSPTTRLPGRTPVTRSFMSRLPAQCPQMGGRFFVPIKKGRFLYAE